MTKATKINEKKIKVNTKKSTSKTTKKLIQIYTGKTMKFNTVNGCRQVTHQKADIFLFPKQPVKQQNLRLKIIIQFQEMQAARLTLFLY